MRIGSRGSKLALVQASYVSELLGGAEVITIATSGDEGASHDGAGTRGDGSTHGGGRDFAHDGARGEAASDKSRWVDAIERALLRGEIDLAVHSAKDVPGELAQGLSLLGAPERAPVEDVICGAGGLGDLEDGAKVGTSSLRRASQLRAARPDVEVVAMAGNVDTRLRKLSEDDDLSAIVLAKAGLSRLGLEAEIGATLDGKGFVPSPGQGILALEGRDGDDPVREAVEAITDAGAFACLRAERALAKALGASCNTPLGANASLVDDGAMLLRCWLGLPDGSQWLSDELEGSTSAPEELGMRLAERVISAGAAELLSAAEAIAR